MYPIDVFEILVSNLQMLNDETTELQNKFIQWTTRLPEQIRMQYAADLQLATEIGYAYADHTGWLFVPKP